MTDPIARRDGLDRGVSLARLFVGKPASLDGHNHSTEPVARPQDDKPEHPKGADLDVTDHSIECSPALGPVN